MNVCGLDLRWKFAATFQPTRPHGPEPPHFAASHVSRGKMLPPVKMKIEKKYKTKIFKIQIKINQKTPLFLGVSRGRVLVLMMMMLTLSFSNCFRPGETLRKDTLLSENETGSGNPCYVVTQDICVWKWNQKYCNSLTLVMLWYRIFSTCKLQFSPGYNWGSAVAPVLHIVL